MFGLIFPACNCPFGLCHQVTGDCICPPRVTGDRCDECEPGSYGYDGLIGCQVIIALLSKSGGFTGFALSFCPN